MAIVYVPDLGVGAGHSPISVEPVTNLNGATVTEQNLQRFLFGLAVGAGAVVDAPGSSAFGLKVEVTRESQVTSATLSNVAVNVAAVTLQALNASRRGWLLFNDSTQILLVKYGSGASATSFSVKIAAQGYYEMPRPIYSGLISGIWLGADASGAARMTEL